MPYSSDLNLNPFGLSQRGASDPAVEASAVVPSDSADLAPYAKALRVYNPLANAATVRVTFAAAASDASVVDLSFPPGLTFEPSAVRRVWQSGTTAGLSIHAYTR